MSEPAAPVSLPRVPSVPSSVEIAITGRCNLSCKYCFYADEMVALSDLPTERWLAFFEELGRLAVQRVTLTGGEVFTRPDLFELIDGVVANRMRYSLLSNGTLISEKVLQQFEIGRRRLRLDSIQLSVDGSRAEVHDKSRPGSFERTMRALRLLRQAGFPVVVRVTINRHNVDDLENIARLLLDEMGLDSFGTNEAFHCGIVERQEEGIVLTPAQRRRHADADRTGCPLQRAHFRHGRAAGHGPRVPDHRRETGCRRDEHPRPGLSAAAAASLPRSASSTTAPSSPVTSCTRSAWARSASTTCKRSGWSTRC